MALPRMPHRCGVVILTLLFAGCGVEPEPDQPAGLPAPPPEVYGTEDGGQPAERPPRKERRGREDKPDVGTREGDAAAAKMAPTQATVSRDTALKEKPFLDAKTLEALAAGTAVTVTARDGGWFRVKTSEGQGWVRLLHVSTQPAAGGTGAEELEAAARIATGRAGGGNIANTTGVRGLSAEQLREAEPDCGDLERLEANGVDREQAVAYARKHGLERRDVPELPESR